jgi:ABC-type transport system substrate-binding protein
LAITLNMLSAQVDAQDITEAVAQDWERIGITVNRIKEDPASFVVKLRNRKTGVTGELFAPPTPLDEPGPQWLRTLHTRGPQMLLAEGPFDQAIDEIAAELDDSRRLQLTEALGTRMVEEHRGVRIGVKPALWAVSKKVGNWPTLANVQYATNLDLITAA